MKTLKPWQKWVLAGAGILILAGVGFFVYLRSFRAKPQPPQTTPPTVQVPENTAPSQPTPTTPAPQVSLFYPMSNYPGRITFRWYGKLVTTTEQAEPCGAKFSGYHTADDLETTSAEKNTNVPVFAISDGTIAQIGRVSGYGGLIVLRTTINNQNYTLYYGHIDLSSTNLSSGDTVKAGQKLSNLGAECSLQTDGERKHLHFAIHKGTGIDVRGYVQNLTELANWINPKNFLIQNNATQE
jgi:murein DD-endopeptidase MepM/ murein hydrolase activator NlpD